MFWLLWRIFHYDGVSNMQKGAISYAARVMMQRVLGLVLFWLGARSLDWHIWVYFGTNFAVAAISMVIMFRVNAETLTERGKVVTDSPSWDKVLLGLYWILHFFVIHLVAGLEWQGTVSSETLYWAGMVLLVPSAVLAMAALVVNTYLESTARIQTDRDQQVISTGVYGVVRHPTYLAVLLSALGISLVFSTLYVCLIAVIVGAIIILRTYLEDKMLKERLDGYMEYAQNVRYRLIPGIW